MISRIAKLTFLLAFGAVGTAHADVLWDQSTLDPNGPGIANSESPGFGGFVVHGVNDVIVDGNGWNVDSLTLYYSTWNFDWQTDVVDAYLHVFPKTGALPTEDPTLSALVPVTVVFGSDEVEYLAITASGLDLDLAPGEYWLSLTPRGPAGVFGANLQWPAVATGDDVALYIVDSPEWIAPYPGYDGAFLVEGTPLNPTPVEATTWGAIKSLYR